jgi:hypothetical protein
VRFLNGPGFFVQRTVYATAIVAGIVRIACPETTELPLVVPIKTAKLAPSLTPIAAAGILTFLSFAERLMATITVSL